MHSAMWVEPLRQLRNTRWDFFLRTGQFDQSTNRLCVPPSCGRSAELAEPSISTRATTVRMGFP
jgi:hypothetical protein